METGKMKTKLCPILNKQCVGNECEWWITCEPEQRNVADIECVPMVTDCAMVSLAANLLDLDYRNYKLVEKMTNDKQ